jgi:HAD superfamily hydrolase (TIGR01509 family)
MTPALIFDFDGVIADSEMLVNGAMADGLTRLGLPTTRAQSLATFLGKRWPEVVALVEARLAAEGKGGTLPALFADDLKSEIHTRFQDELREVSGARAFIRAHAHLPRTIASSSSADRLALCLEVLDLAQDFGPHVYSADLVTRGKPHPDIFLLAAERLNAHPADCIVIEDSPGGIRAARAAGMTAIGLHAAAHLPSDHAEALRTAGAHQIAANWDAVQAIVTAILQKSSP